MKLLLTLVMVAFGTFAGASAPEGKIDASAPAAMGVWQSLDSLDQAVGLTKRLAYVASDGHTLATAGVFAGLSKPALTAPAEPIRALGGLTFSAPGANLDWLLGTKMGDMWVPKLKTGLLFAYDLTRIKSVHWNPNFIGLGLTYPLGGN